MDEQATFEARAVLVPKRARRARLTLFVPILAFAVVAWAGFSGDRSDEPPIADAPAPAVTPPALVATDASPSSGPVIVPDPGLPTQVLGLDVRHLDDLEPANIDRDTAVAIHGWYVATSISDCPPVAVIYHDGALPEILPDADPVAYCQRSGVLYASRPDSSDRLPTNNLEDNRSKNAGLPAVPATIITGVVAPPEIEFVTGDAFEVAVVAEFIDSGRSLIINYVGWTGGS
jgi:hypothetical protein